MRRLIAVSGAVLALAAVGCGSSGNNAKMHQAAVNYCVYGGTDGGGTGDRPSCECAVKAAEQQGYSDSKLLAEMKDRSAVIADSKLIRISLLCAGH
jgi:hypothetical protein